MTHICVSKPTTIGSDNGLSPGRRQAIIQTSAGILLIGPLGTNFSEILIEIYIFSFRKMHLKMSSAKRRPFCLGLNVLSTDACTGICQISLMIDFDICRSKWSKLNGLNVFTQRSTLPTSPRAHLSPFRQHTEHQYLKVNWQLAHNQTISWPCI